MMLKVERAEVLLIASLMVFQGMLVVPLVISDQAGGSLDENRLPSGYLTVFHDDFQSGTLSPSRWAFWTGHWSTDNVAKTPTGGIYNGENYYLTESPYPNNHGAPLDDNGNTQGINRRIKEFRYLSRHPLLNLQPPSKKINNARDF